MEGLEGIDLSPDLSPRQTTVGSGRDSPEAAVRVIAAARLCVNGTVRCIGPGNGNGQSSSGVPLVGLALTCSGRQRQPQSTQEIDIGTRATRRSRPAPPGAEAAMTPTPAASSQSTPSPAAASTTTTTPDKTPSTTTTSPGPTKKRAAAPVRRVTAFAAEVRLQKKSKRLRTLRMPRRRRMSERSLTS